MNMTRRLHFLAPAAAALLLLSACAATGGDPDGSPPGSPEDTMPGRGTEGAMPDQPEGIPNEVWTRIVDQISGRADATDVPSVVTAEAVTWSDGSLGCPEPGSVYTQALVPGYLVVLELDGEELEFHASESGEVILCDDPQPPVDGGTVDR